MRILSSPKLVLSFRIFVHFATKEMKGHDLFQCLFCTKTRKNSISFPFASLFFSFIICDKLILLCFFILQDYSNKLLDFQKLQSLELIKKKNLQSLYLEHQQAFFATFTFTTFQNLKNFYFQFYLFHFSLFSSIFNYIIIIWQKS
jgi:hypothetical protein